MIAVLLENEGYQVERKFNLGGTAVCFEALRNGAIDVYPEYTGSLSEEILKSNTRLDHQTLNGELKSQFQLEISPSFGFNNTYALAMSAERADALGIHKISDLKKFPQLTAALSHEFLKRQDGWENLKSAYGMSLQPIGIDHGLAYQALSNGKTEITDVFSTDGEIERYDLIILEDDLGFFPTYNAVAFFSQSMDSKAKAIVSKLDHVINEEEMQAMNAEVLFENGSFNSVATEFLIEKGLIDGTRQKAQSSFWVDIFESMFLG